MNNFYENFIIIYITIAKLAVDCVNIPYAVF